MADKNNLLLMFEKPREPIFTPKGEDNSVFAVPDSYLTDDYKAVGLENRTVFGETTEIEVDYVDPPKLEVALQLGRQDNFSLFIPLHRTISSSLIEIFMKAKDINELQSVAAYSRDRVNPQLFNYALSVAILHRPDTKNMDLPLFSSVFPDKFVDPRVFERARQESNVVKQGKRRPIVIPRDYTASDSEPEHALWYFREDMGVNLHHWHWHLVYPFESETRSIVDKDRRGELFYYMHQQIIARYNVERLCNELPRVVPLTDLKKPILEGYFPKLDSMVASRSWPPRTSNALMADIARKADEMDMKVENLELWRSKFLEAINQGEFKWNFTLRKNYIVAIMIFE
jgi:tyrosinase